MILCKILLTFPIVGLNKWSDRLHDWLQYLTPPYIHTSTLDWSWRQATTLSVDIKLSHIFFYDQWHVCGMNHNIIMLSSRKGEDFRKEMDILLLNLLFTYCGTLAEPFHLSNLQVCHGKVRVKIETIYIMYYAFTYYILYMCIPFHIFHTL